MTAMRHAATLTATALTALALTGCTGPTEGDQLACERTINAHNHLFDELNSDDTDRDTLRALRGAVPGTIADAQTVAEDPTIRLELATLARYVDDNTANPDDPAWLLQYATVEEACQDAGVDVELTDRSPD